MLILSTGLFEDKHLTGLLGVLILNIVLSLFVSRDLRNNPRRFIFIMMISFIVLEITKLTYMTIQDGAFPVYQLPLHLCSIPLYLYPLMYFIKGGTFVERYIKPTAYGAVLLAGIVALAMPVNIIGFAPNWLPVGSNILPIISFVYHGLMIFSSITLLRTRFYEFKYSDALRVIPILVFFAIIAMIANVTLDKDFMLLYKGNGSPLQFLIDISYPLYLVSMIVLSIVLIGLAFTITSLVYRMNINTNKNKTILKKQENRS